MDGGDMPLTEPAARKLAALVHQLMLDDPRRGKPWDEHGIVRCLERVAGRPSFDVAMALLRAAADLATKTPGGLSEPGCPHWVERPEGGIRVPRNPMPHEECAQHPGQFRTSCSGCASQRLAPVVEPESAEETEGWREALAAARARCCSHGVELDHCHEAHDQEESE